MNKVQLTIQALRDMDIKPVSLTFKLNEEQILKLGFDHTPSEQEVIDVLLKIVNEREIKLPRMTQMRTDDEEKVWFHVPQGGTSCSCGANVFHKEYDIMDNKIYGVCNACRKDLYQETQPERIDEELKTGVWKV